MDKTLHRLIPGHHCVSVLYHVCVCVCVKETKVRLQVLKMTNVLQNVLLLLLLLLSRLQSSGVLLCSAVVVIKPRLLSFCSQTRQPVFVQLLQAVFRVYHCNWLVPVQKGSVENCIKVLSDVGKKAFIFPSKSVSLTFHQTRSFMNPSVSVCVCFLAAKGRAIAIPVDLDNQVNNLFVKSNNIVQKTAMSWRLSARNAARRDSVVTASRDYRNIIERLQVPYTDPPMSVNH